MNAFTGTISLIKNSCAGRILFVGAAILAPVFSSFAYGPMGHEIVGAIADQRLAGTPTAAKLSALIDGFSLEKASVIADEIKGWDKRGADAPGIFHYTSRPRIDAQLSDFWRANQPTHDHSSAMPSHHWFHYTDVPIFDPEKYADGATGRSQWDLVHMMRYCIAVLRNERPENNERKITKPIAIILLAHYVGDMHEPLHVGAEYFTEEGQPVNPDESGPALEDQGGNTLQLKLTTGPEARGKSHKLHGYWDNDAVMSNLPQFPESMPKEERRSQMERAKAALVARLAKEEPRGWKAAGGVKLIDLPEAWANEILPIAREAHARLQFGEIGPRQDEDGVVAAGNVEEKPADDHVSYHDWSARVVHDELHKAGWRLADLLTELLRF